MKRKFLTLGLLSLTLAACGLIACKGGDEKTQEDNTDQHTDSGKIKEGDSCKPGTADFCLDDFSVMTCVEGFGDKYKWVKLDCYGLNECVEGECREVCNPDNFNYHTTCEEHNAVGTVYRHETFDCVKKGDKYIFVVTTKFCSACGQNNECILTDEEKGVNARPGAPCRSDLFAPRCDGNNAIVCANLREVREDSVSDYYAVASLKCAEKCAVDDVTGAAYCHEGACDDSIESYLGFHMQDGTNCIQVDTDNDCYQGKQTIELRGLHFAQLGSDYCENDECIIQKNTLANNPDYCKTDLCVGKDMDSDEECALYMLICYNTDSYCRTATDLVTFSH